VRWCWHVNKHKVRSDPVMAGVHATHAVYREKRAGSQIIRRSGIDDDLNVAGSMDALRRERLVWGRDAAQGRPSSQSKSWYNHNSAPPRHDL